jgi:hypothetical protein
LDYKIFIELGKGILIGFSWIIEEKVHKLYYNKWRKSQAENSWFLRK